MFYKTKNGWNLYNQTLNYWDNYFKSVERFHTTCTLRVLTAQQDPKAFAQILYYMYMYVTFHGITEYVRKTKIPL